MSKDNDVLSVALKTCDHPGRVRWIEGFVAPKLFCKLPRKKMNKISKMELFDELERQMKEITEHTVMIYASNLGSPILSDKSSYQLVQEDIKSKPKIAKELMMNNGCVALDLPPPTERK